MAVSNRTSNVQAAAKVVEVLKALARELARLGLEVPQSAYRALGAALHWRHFFDNSNRP
jgi:hypothetical protein